jgi:hypothetical protein
MGGMMFDWSSEAGRKAIEAASKGVASVFVLTDEMRDTQAGRLRDLCDLAAERALAAAGVEALVAEAVTAERERIAVWLESPEAFEIAAHGSGVRSLGDAVRSGVSHGSGDRPPDDFWREVPCGHPPEPMAWIGADGPFCHCGGGLDESRALPLPADARVAALIPCDKCGCVVGVGSGDEGEAP